MILEEDRKKKKCYKKAAKKAITSSAIRDHIKDKSFKKAIEKQSEDCATRALQQISEELGTNFSSMSEYTSTIMDEISDKQMDNVIKKY